MNRSFLAQCCEAAELKILIHHYSIITDWLGCRGGVGMSLALSDRSIRCHNRVGRDQCGGVYPWATERARERKERET